MFWFAPINQAAAYVFVATFEKVLPDSLLANGTLVWEGEPQDLLYDFIVCAT